MCKSLTDLSNTKVTLPSGQERLGANYQRPGRKPEDANLGSGMAQDAALSILDRRARLRRAMGDE